ncbi:MAG TPA: sigma-70 family RNA polymerase sigma factor [Verrucomicrobiae bacterium]|nr:sigma-70 family RNA polymerase sigma factor [Verrucomicrobiae bacterium]
MITERMAATANNDVELVRATLAGDRDAFGQIVARYQSLICTLTYSATGNFGQSEDLAQETFLAAWNRLADLREPEKLRGWLCGIARNRVNDWLRKQKRDPGHAAEPIEHISGSHSPEPLPVDRAISNEEQDILWRSLEKIPETYRETLVLFYREHQSIEAVAEKLELTEKTVHQRLSRGRKLLAEEVTSFVEGALARTNPGQAFTLGVLAALPLTLATSAKAATIAAAAAKGGATATGITFATLLSVLIGPVLGLLSAVFGVKMRLDAARTPRERAFVWRHILTFFGMGTVFVVAMFLFFRFSDPLWHRNPKLFIAVSVAMPLAYAIFVIILMRRFTDADSRIREEEQRLHPELFREEEDSPPLLLRRVFNIPWEYRSRATLLGLPLVHCRSGRLPGQKAQPAVGWIACGEKAYGILFASGAFAVGGISMGGASLGIISLGGFSAGLLAFGGFALGAISFGGFAAGLIASGGFAFAWHAAFGGIAAAHELAAGGAVLAGHANDPVAREFFERHPWLNIQRARTLQVFWIVCSLPLAFQLFNVFMWRRKQLKRATPH